MTPSALAILLAASSPQPGILLTIAPERVCVDARGNRNPNFDLQLENPGDEPVMVTEIMAHAFDARGALIEQRVLWQDALAAMGEGRVIAPRSETLIFNPFTFDHPQNAARIDYRVSFDDGSAREMSIKPSECTTRANLHLPLMGRLLVYDGYDVLAHHRRDRWHRDPQFRSFGVVDNPWRFAIDFVPVDVSGRLARGEGRRIEDFYGWNSPVLSPAAGTVLAVRGDMPDNALGSEAYPKKPLSEDEMNNGGNYVLIDHGHGEISSMTHLKAGSIRVRVGDKVREGQEVARVGNSGATPIPHLHYELRSGFGVRGVRSMPPYFVGLELVGAPTPKGKVAINTGDVVIAR